eukprot:1856352-Pyramimonas_sp.AAC.1
MLDSALVKSSTLAPCQRMSLCISELGMTIFACPCSRIRIVIMSDILLRPMIAGRFSPEPSATLAEWISSLGTAGAPAGSRFFLRATLQCKDLSHTAAPCPTPDT